MEEPKAGKSVAMLGVGGARTSGTETSTSNSNNDRRGGGKDAPFGNLVGFLMQGRRSRGEEGGQTRGELELLSGATRPDSDSAQQLTNRFKVTYDTRTKQAPKRLQSSGRGKVQERNGNTGFRSKNPTNYLYGRVGDKKTTWWGK